MEPIKLGQITNADIYIDDARLVGRVKSFEIEGIEYEGVEHSALGMVAKVKLPGRTLEPMSGKIVWEWLDRDLRIKAARPNKTVRIQMQSYVDVFDQDGLETNESYRLIHSVDLLFVKGIGANGSNGEADEQESEVSITRLSVTTSKSESPIMEISVYDGINRVNGVDVWPQY